MEVPSVSSCVGGLGNTKPVPKSRKSKINAAIRWSFTLNNYSNFDYDNICAKCVNICRYAIIGKERAPSTGTLHLQGYIEFRKRARPLGIFGNPCIHWEVAKGTKEHNVDYCSKEDADPWIFPRPWRQEIKDMYKWQEELANLLKKEPNDRDLVWIWEPTGGAGKTCFQKWVFTHYKRCVVLSGSASDMKNIVKQYEDAQGHLPEIVLINIPRSKKDFVSYGGMEEIKDMFFCSPKYEGGMVCYKNPHVIVFSNSTPIYDQMSPDRWQVGQIVSKEENIVWEL